jgi:hypothetical protein
VRTHKGELVTIMASVNDMTPAQYEEGLTFPKLIKDLTDLLTDEEFLGFFV